MIEADGRRGNGNRTEPESRHYEVDFMPGSCYFVEYNVLLSQHPSHACKLRHADTMSPCSLPQDRQPPPCCPSAVPGMQPFDLQGIMGDLAGDFGCRIDVSP